MKPVKEAGQEDEFMSGLNDGISGYPVIWLHTNDPQLLEKARKILQDSTNTIYFSSIYIWEIQMKNLKAPVTFPSSADIQDSVKQK